MNWHPSLIYDSLRRLYLWKWHALSTVAILFIVIIIAAVQFSPEAPYPQLDLARLAVSTARHAAAGIYATSHLSATEGTWQRTRQAIQHNHAKWFFLRDFEQVRQLAALAAQQAGLAADRALAVRDSLALVTIATMLAVKERMANFQSAFEEIPLPLSSRRKFMQSALHLAECEVAFGREDFTRAAACAQAALLGVSNASNQTEKVLSEYLANLRKWRSWVEETIALSARENREAIIVDKLAHVCMAYRGGQLQTQYPIELGPRWLGQKRRNGDGATPEGRYFITKKKENAETRYYKALEINYPNDEDRLRFAAAQNDGTIPRSAHPGGLIEIHGEGGKGADWTAGCVALQNPHIDEIYALANIGTPVTIVGSLNGTLGQGKSKLATLQLGR